MTDSLEKINNEAVETKEQEVVQDKVLSEVVNQDGQVEEDPHERNWKKFREEQAKLRKENEENAKLAQKRADEAAAFKAALEALSEKPKNSKQDYDRDYDNQSDADDEDARLEKKLAKILADRDKKEKEEKRLREMQEMPRKLAAAHKDFNDVCTDENLDYLTFHHPELMNIYGNMPESFEKWDGLYKVVKKFIPNSSTKEKARVENNLKKPQSASVAGNNRSGDVAPVYLDEKRKMDNWQRMNRVMKGSGG